MRGSHLSLPWLVAQFNNSGPLPDDADKEQIMRYAKAYILMLNGEIVFFDKTNTMLNLLYLPLLENFQKAGTYS